jgi:outer membrane protein assembly factor BamA
MSNWRSKASSAASWVHQKTGEGVQGLVGAVNKHVVGSKTSATHAVNRLLSLAGVGKVHDVRFNMETGKLQVFIPQSAGLKSFVVEGNDAKELNQQLTAKLANLERSSFATGSVRKTVGAKRSAKRKTLRRK